MIRIFYIILLFLLMLMPYNAYAFTPLHILVANPATPVPTVDPPVTIETTFKTAQKTFAQASALKDQIEKEVKSAYQSCCSEFMSLFEGKLPIDKDGANIQDTSGTIKTKNPESLSNGFFELFLSLPCDDQKETYKNADEMLECQKKNSEYRKKAAEFYEDTLLEIYNSVLVLESDLANITVDLEKAQETLTSTEKNQDNNSSVQTNAQAYETLDSLLVIWHQLVAMRAQLTAADAIANSLSPAYRGKKDKHSFNFEAISNKRFASSFKQSQTETLSFAKVEDAKKVVESLTKSAVTAQSMGISGMKFHRVQSVSKHAFTLHKDKMAELDKLKDIADDVTKALDAHNAILTLQSTKEIIDSYNQQLAMHKKILQEVKNSDTYAINFLGRYFSDPWQVWSGGNLGENFANYDIRKGISGWAKEAFDVAKASKLSPLEVEDVVMPDADFEDMQFDANEDIGTMVKNSQSKVDINVSVPIANPSKQEEIDKEMRETRKLAWEIGANAMKMLAAEPQKWGNQTKKFPVWNDIKGFYNQYLDYKYENIEEYLRLDIDDIKNLILGNSSKDDEKALAAKKATVNAANDEIVTANKEAQSELKSLSSKNLNTIKNKVTILEAQRKDILSQTDAPAQYIQQARNAILDWQKKQEAEQIAAKARNKVSEEFDEWLGETTPKEEVEIPITGDEKNQTYLKLMSDLSSGATTLDKIRSDVLKKEKEVKTFQVEADRIKKEIANIRSSSMGQYITSVGSIKSKFAYLLSLAENKKEATRGEEDFGEIDIEGGILDPTTLLNRVISHAMKDVYDRISARIKKTKEELADMGDDLYLPEHHNKVVEIHKRLINDLRMMPLLISSDALEILGIAAKIYIYEKLIPADISTEEEAYFVGLPPKERDLKAPKMPPYSLLPPMREVFYFDETDRYNVQPGKVSKGQSLSIFGEDFLNYGGEIPEIWKLMLSDNPFVEKDLNLKSLLNKGCSKTMFFQGLSFPCKVANSNFVLAPNSKGTLEVIKANKLPKTLKVCSDIKHKKGNKFYRPDSDYEFEVTTSDDDIICPSSELGTILEADEDNNLYFRSTSNDAFQRMIDTMENAVNDEEQSGNDRMKDYIYAQAMYTVNQVGEFLKISETELTYRQTVDELRQKINQVNEDLRELLKQFGFVPSNNYDVAKESDYNLTRTKLFDFRSSQMQKAQSLINKVDTKDNEPVVERLKIYTNTLNNLKKDKEAKIRLNMSSSHENDLDEQIKTAKTNETVQKEYSKEADKVAKKMQNANVEIYSAIY